MRLVKRPPGTSDGRRQGPEKKKKTGGDDRDVYERVGKNNKRSSGMCLFRANK